MYLSTAHFSKFLQTVSNSLKIRLTYPQKMKEILNFEASSTIKDAVKDLKNAFSKNLFVDPLNNDQYFNIKKMQEINLNATFFSNKRLGIL